MLTLAHQLLPVPQGVFRIDRAIPDLQKCDQANQSALTSVPRFSLIMPTYNEAGNIEKIVALLSGLLDRALPDNYELVVVDDDSPDRTWERACELMSHYPQLRVMCRQQERGLSTAVIRGWQAARGEVLGVIDGDLQHPPEVLLKLLQAIDQADLAVASRHVEGGGVSTWSATRRFLSRGAQVLGLVMHWSRVYTFSFYPNRQHLRFRKDSAMCFYIDHLSRYRGSSRQSMTFNRFNRLCSGR